MRKSASVPGPPGSGGRKTQPTDRATLITLILCALVLISLFQPSRLTAASGSAGPVPELKPKTVPAAFPLQRFETYEAMIRNALSLQKDFGDLDLAIQTLDDLLDTVSKRLKTRERYSKRILLRTLNDIGRILTRDYRIQCGKNILLIQALNGQIDNRKALDCDDFSSIYLIIAERIGLPIQPVYVPSHVFLQAESSEGQDFYWEPTLGEEKNSAYYKKRFGLLRRTGFPRILNQREFQAILICNLGVAWYKKGYVERAGELFELAVGMNPVYVEAYNNWGVTFARAREWDRALECYGQALRMNPRNAAALLNAGISHFRQGDYSDALSCFDKALGQDPGNQKAIRYRAAVSLALQNQPRSPALLARRKNPLPRPES